MYSAELRSFAEDRDIIVIDGKLRNEQKSISISDRGQCAIVVDTKKIATRAEETVIMAHELGHCETGAFYNEKTLELRSRMEFRADKWAIKKLVTEDELIEAFENGILEIWELAEFFDVTEDFMVKVCELYGYYNRVI